MIIRTLAVRTLASTVACAALLGPLTSSDLRAQQADPDFPSAAPSPTPTPTTTTTTPSSSIGTRGRTTTSSTDPNAGLTFGRPAPAKTPTPAPAPAPTSTSAPIAASTPTRTVSPPTSQAQAPVAATGPAASAPIASPADPAIGTSPDSTPTAASDAGAVPVGALQESAATEPVGATVEAPRGEGISSLMLALIAAAVAALGAALLTAKLLMPWPRPRVSCEYEVTPAALLDGTLTLHAPDLMVSAEATHGMPSILGDFTIEGEEWRDD